MGFIKALVMDVHDFLPNTIQKLTDRNEFVEREDRSEDVP